MTPCEDKTLMRFALLKSWPDSPTSREKDCYRHIQSDSIRYDKLFEHRQAVKRTERCLILFFVLTGFDDCTGVRV